jgi:hypothetical protein
VVVKIEMDYSLADFVDFEEGEGDCYLPMETVDLYVIFYFSSLVIY